MLLILLLAPEITNMETRSEDEGKRKSLRIKWKGEDIASCIVKIELELKI